jgi:hypothetical protein
VASDPDDLDPGLLAAVRGVCTALPEVAEERAWVGLRWVVRRRTFAHLFAVDEDSSPAIRKVAEVLPLPATVVSFRSAGSELRALRGAGYPFAYAGWGRDAVAMALDDATDWEEVRELLTESYCLLAPKTLQALVDRPGT